SAPKAEEPRERSRSVSAASLKKPGADDESGHTAIGRVPTAATVTPARPTGEKAPVRTPAKDEQAGRTLPDVAETNGPANPATRSASDELKTEAFDPLIGTVPLGQYRIVRLIGRGGFGSVYLAEQVGIDRLAVLKVVHHELHHDPVFELRFHREAKVLAT